MSVADLLDGKRICVCAGGSGGVIGRVFSVGDSSRFAGRVKSTLTRSPAWTSTERIRTSSRPFASQTALTS